ncbi:hypothetical protein IFU39_16640 [Paenibacillus sp. CFBP 13594]|uniref:hypothetical protein n=1 Tax=Paenibacillus sp. CFBP 13594 TaxID=2774037 RepID=UPI001782EA66|nr:hypothetical protein [Paenibacillus sp. CFBP 13594]MBD8839442.1 hypothetical protein [Paenibacillus sp. CFBP 13594]
MRDSIFDYLNQNELDLLVRSETIVSLVHEVAELRAENELLRKNEQLEWERQQDRLNEQNKEIGNILVTMMDNITYKI